MNRRVFLSGATLGALAAGDPSAHAAENTPPTPREVRLEHLRPNAIDAAMRVCPTLFQPLGTVEWHGLHNVVSLDALKAHALCVQAAQRGGGLVAPPLYGGVGGLDQPHTFVIELENDVFSILLRGWVEKLCREAARQGCGLGIVPAHGTSSRAKSRGAGLVRCPARLLSGAGTVHSQAVPADGQCNRAPRCPFEPPNNQSARSSIG